MLELRLIDPYGYDVPGALQSNVPDANADQVTDHLRNDVAPKHADESRTPQHPFAVRDYTVKRHRV